MCWALLSQTPCHLVLSYLLATSLPFFPLVPNTHHDPSLTSFLGHFKLILLGSRTLCLLLGPGMANSSSAFSCTCQLEGPSVSYLNNHPQSITICCRTESGQGSARAAIVVRIAFAASVPIDRVCLLWTLNSTSAGDMQVFHTKAHLECKRRLVTCGCSLYF